MRMLYHLLQFILYLSLCQSTSNVLTRQAAQEYSCTTPNNEPGRCISLDSCHHLYDMMVNHPTNPSVREFLRKSQCYRSLKNEMPVVCCSVSRRQYTLSKVCGKSEKLDMRVVNGVPSSPGDWPWMVALGYHKDKNPSLWFFCGASLISDKWALTAAHCVTNLSSEGLELTTARLGDINLDSKVDDQASPVDVPIEEIIPHPNFTSTPAIINDIALIRLKNTIKFTQNIRPVCLFRGNKSWSNPKPYVAGWGSLQYRGKTTSCLHEATLSVIDNARCAEMYAKQQEVKIDHNVLCAAEAGKDACQGDSGGPLMFSEKDSKGDHKFFLGGIVSSGLRCADPDYPGIYTRVAEYIDWISETTGLPFN